MGTINFSWDENNSLRSAATLAASGTDTNDIDCGTGGNADGALIIDVTTDITIGSSSGVTVEFFRSANGGTTDDDVAALRYSVTASERRTVRFYGEAYLACKITNEDGSNATGNISQIFAFADGVTA